MLARPTNLLASRHYLRRARRQTGAMGLIYRTASYRGVSGRSPGIVYLDTVPAPGYPAQYRGVLHVVGVNFYAPERIKTIRDGTSKTLLAGDSASRTNLGFHTLWAYSFAFYTLSAITTQSRTLLADYDACVATGGTGGADPCRRGWGGGHRQSLNFAMADGSVRTVSFLVDIRLLARLATIDGGEPDTDL